MLAGVNFAFGNKVALTADPVSIGATYASALPTRSRTSWGPRFCPLLSAELVCMGYLWQKKAPTMWSVLWLNL